MTSNGARFGSCGLAADWRWSRIIFGDERERRFNVGGRLSTAEWVTAATAVMALAVSVVAFVYSRRGTIAAEQSASTAADALVENRRSADAAVVAAAAAQRSADLADETLHPAPVVDLVITKAGGDSWVLRNVGAATARGIYHVDEVQSASGLVPTSISDPGWGSSS